MAIEANTILESVDEGIQSCLGDRGVEPASPPGTLLVLLTSQEKDANSRFAERASGYDHPLVSALSKLARTSWSLSHSLTDLCDAFLDFDCLAPLDRLALVAESVAKELQGCIAL